MPGASECCAAAWAADREELVIPGDYAVIPARPAGHSDQRFQAGCIIFRDDT